MKFLLLGDRSDVLLIKYQLLEKDWKLDVQQCYSFESAELKLKDSGFNCLLYSPFLAGNRSAEYQKLKALNQRFGIPIKLWRDEDA